MSSVGYRQLWAVDPGGWRAAGAAWAGLTGPLDRRLGELRTATGRLRGGWSGAAATAADTRLSGLRDELASIAPALIEVDQVLAELAGGLAVAKARLSQGSANTSSPLERGGAAAPSRSIGTVTAPRSSQRRPSRRA